MKTTSSFKLPKPVKRIMANITDKQLRGDVKRSFIKAVVVANTSPKSNREDKNKEQDTE